MLQKLCTVCVCMCVYDVGCFVLLSDRCCRSCVGFVFVCVCMMLAVLCCSLIGVAEVGKGGRN